MKELIISGNFSIKEATILAVKQAIELDEAVNYTFNGVSLIANPTDQFGVECKRLVANYESKRNLDLKEQM